MLSKITPVIAILTIGGLTCFALSLGYDGVLLAANMAIIGGLGGYAVHRRKG